MPTDVFVTKWDEDPLVRGSYSWLSVVRENQSDIVSDLIKPIEQEGHGTIYFAGEAVHKKHRGYIHSAYLSGQDAAETCALAIV